MDDDLARVEVDYEAARRRAENICAADGHQFNEKMLAFTARAPSERYTGSVCLPCTRCCLTTFVEFHEGVRVDRFTAAWAEVERLRARRQQLCGEGGHRTVSGESAVGSGCQVSPFAAGVEACTRCGVVLAVRPCA